MIMLCSRCLAVFLYLLLFQQASSVLTISIVSDPPGSVHSISTPVTLTCVVDGYTHMKDSISYQWFQWCSMTDEYSLLTEEDHYTLDVSLTPATSCWNGVLCNVTDMQGNIGSGFMMLPNRTGVGLTIEGNTVVNSSTVVTSSTTSFGKLYCLSSNHVVTSAPYWVLPNGGLVNQSTPEYIVELSSDPYSLISLSVNNHKEYIKGLYQCVIQDEYHNIQTLHVWIFPEGFQEMPEHLDYHADSVETFRLLCVFQGTHGGSIQWYKNGVPISASDEDYDITHHVNDVDPTSLVYVSILLNNTMFPWEFAGEYECEFMANIAEEQNGWLTEAKVVSFYFIVQSIGEHYTIQCPIPSTQDAIVWVMKDGKTLIEPQPIGNGSLTIDFNPIKDTDHNSIFICQSNYSSTLKFTVIGVEPPPTTDILSVSFARPPISISGHSLDLQCTADKLNMGFTEQPEIIWLHPGGFDAASNVTIKNNGSTSYLSILSLRTSDAGLYSCIATLTSTALGSPFIRSVEEVLPVKMAAHVVSLAVNTTNSITDSLQLEVYSASSALFTCTANISPTIDISITVQTTWSIGSDLQLVTNKNDDFIVVTESVNVSELVYESQLLVPLVQNSTIGDTVECRVVVMHDPDSDFYVVDSEAVSVVKNIAVLDPKISVTVHPLKLSVLDFSPYNSFILICAVEGLEHLVVQPAVFWSLNGNDLTQEDGYSVNTTTVQPGTMHHTLTADPGGSSSSPGDYQYYCNVILTLPNDTSISFSESAVVTVEGPSHPQSPTDIAVTAVHSQKAIISWLVQTITYGPETYQIQYGLGKNDLIDETPLLNGSLDEYQMYNLTLSSLLPNKTYYYRILTMNEYSVITSSVFIFKTPEISFSIEILQVPKIDAGLQQNLTCLTKSNMSETLPVVKWFSPNGHEIIRGNSFSTWTLLPPEYDDDITRVTIYSPAVSTSDAGLYSCRAIVDGGETLKVEEYLVVGIPTPEVNVTISSMGQHGIYEGHDVSISCEAHLSPHVNTDVTMVTVWSHNNHDIASADEGQVSIHDEGLQSTITIASINESFAGEYACEMTISHKNDMIKRSSDYETTVIPVTIRRNITLNVQDLPQHNIIIDSHGSTVVGNSVTLTCSVISPDPLMDTLTLKWYSSQGEVLQNASLVDPTPNDILTVDLEFQFLKASDGGRYYCYARSDLNAIRLNQETTMEKALIVSLPPPSLNISLLPSTFSHYAGSPLEMICSTELIPEVDVDVFIIPTWFKNNSQQLPNTSRISTTDSKNSSTYVHMNSVIFSTLSKAMDEGEYQCQILLAIVPFSQFIQPPLPADVSISLDVLEPPLHITLSPSAAIILDVNPHNQFSLTCQANTLSDVKSVKKITWRMLRVGSEKLPTLIGDDTTDMSIVEEDLPDGTHSSTLSGLLYTPGEYHFTCDGFIDIAEDIGPSGIKEAVVTVKGPVVPHAAGSPSARRGPTVDSVLINWTVDKITYTPEKYTVLYGQSRDSPDTETVPVTSGNNVTLLNASYQVVITGLELGKLYYYTIKSDNEYGMKNSETKDFVAGFNRSIFLVRLNGVHMCAEWIFRDAKDKISDISTSISSIIKSHCNCSFTSSQITDGQFDCEDGISADVLFYAYIYQTIDTSPETLLNYLSEWRSAVGSASLVVDGVRLLVSNSCEVNSTDETVCSTTTRSGGEGSTTTEGGLPTYYMFIIIGGCVGLLIAAFCICFMVFIVCKFHRKAKESKEESMRMKEIIRASSLPALSPLQMNYDKDGHYTSPKPFPLARYPQTPPPNYMSPRSSVLEAKPLPQRQRTPTKERNSHIYYLNTPPRTMPPGAPQEDPVYELLPETYQTPRRFFPPDVPPRPLTRRRTASRDTLEDKLSTGLSTSRNCIDEAEEKADVVDQKEETSDTDQEGCDYVEMNSVDFSAATI